MVQIVKIYNYLMESNRKDIIIFGICGGLFSGLLLGLAYGIIYGLCGGIFLGVGIGITYKLWMMLK